MAFNYFLYQTVENLNLRKQREFSGGCRCLAPAVVQRRRWAVRRTKKEALHLPWSSGDAGLSAGQSFLRRLSLLRSSSLKRWNRRRDGTSHCNSRTFHVWNFALRATKLRAWIAAGATHLHQLYPADGCKKTIILINPIRIIKK